MSKPVKPVMTNKLHACDNTLNDAHKPSKWSPWVKMFHWSSALFLFLAWVMIVMDENFASDSGFDYLSLHKAFGVSILLWTIARVLSRLMTQSPATIAMPKWQVGISHLTHTALYLLLLAMPLAGILMTWYAGRSIDMFGLFDLPSIVSIDRTQARFFNNLHTSVLWPALWIFTGLHVVAALYHQFVMKDKIMNRM